MNQKIKYLLIGLVFWFLLFLSWEWWKSYPSIRWTHLSFPKTKTERIDSILYQSLMEYRLPGILIGLVENEKLVYLKSVGFSDLESKDSLKVSTPFPVGSISKLATALTASAYFKAAGIPLESTVNELLPQPKKLGPTFDSISILDLLNHSSGLKNPRRLEQLFIHQENRKLVKLPSQLPKSKNKAKETQYSDLNYDLLGYVLESHSGQSFDQLAEELILIPSGMNSSGFNTSPDPMEHTDLKAYQPTFIWKRLEEKKTRFERFPSPSSGLISTGVDLGNAMIHFSRWEMGFIHRHLDHLSGGNGKPAGFQQLNLSGYSFLGHFGEQGGYNGLFFFSKELDKGIFLLTNARDVKDHRVKIAEAVISVLISNP